MGNTSLQISTDIAVKSCYYARVSSDEQKEKETVDSQVSAMKKVITENSEALVGEYVDDGVSGSLSHRPALDRLRDDAKLGVFNKIYIFDPDRLARGLLLQLIVIEELEKLKITIVFLNHKFGNTPSDLLLLQMQGAISQYERAKILERTRRGRRYKAEVRQEFVGYQPPYGLRYIKKSQSADGHGSIEINDAEAKVVKMMFQWVNDGVSARSVVKRLTEMRIPTRGGKPIWRNSSVFRILKRQDYIGKFFYNRVECVEAAKHRIEDKDRKSFKTGRVMRPKSEWITISLPHLRLIPDELFYAVQERLHKNIAFSKRNAKAEYLLSGGLMKCQKCGCSYSGGMMHDKPFYTDGNKRNRFPLPRDCDGPSISAVRIDSIVWHLIVHLLNNPDLFKNYLKATTPTIEQPQELTALESQLKNLQVEEDRLIRGYQKGFLTDEAKVESLMKGIKADRKIIKEKIAIFNGKAKQKKPKLPKTLKGFCRAIQKKLSKLNFEGRRELVRELVKEILFDGEKIIVRGYLPSLADDAQRVEFEVAKKLAML